MRSEKVVNKIYHVLRSCKTKIQAINAIKWIFSNKLIDRNEKQEFLRYVETTHFDKQVNWYE